MKLWVFLTFTALLISCTQETSSQSSNIPGILDVPVGEVYSKKPIFQLSDDYPFPTYTFRAPNRSDSALPFYDYKIGIERSTEKIHHVIAERAYRSPDDCINALNNSKPPILTAFPNITSERNEPISHKQGDLTVDFGCMSSEGDRYMVLTLQIFSASVSATLEAKYEG